MRTRLFSRENRKWWTLVAVGLFMIMLDNTVVNVALPSIQRDLGMSPSELEWVFNAYALTFGVLLLSGGKLAASTVRGFKMPVHAAARWYSWISPPSRSRRLISLPFGCGSAFVGSGGSSASPWWGRSRL
jgi:MFS family permease